MLALRDMSKSAVNIGIALLGALASASAVVWTLAMYRRPPHAPDRSLMWWGTLLASGGLVYCWSTVVGHLSRTRIWTPQWTFLTAGLPFYVFGIWFFFVSTFAFTFFGFTRMMLMECLGIISGQLSRKVAYPQFSEKDSPNADLPPPTLFPK